MVTMPVTKGMGWMSRRWIFTAVIVANLVPVQAANAGDGVAEPFGDWHGFYVGAQTGHSWAGRDRVGLNPSGPSVGELRQSGPVAGFQAGYKWQDRGTVLGLEAEIFGAGVRDTVSGSGVLASTSMKSGAGLRLRLAQARPGFLPYIAGGVSVAQFDYSVTGGGAAIDQTFTTPGFSIAVGVERALPNHRSWWLEYRYTEYDGQVLTGPSYSTKATPVEQALRFGINLRF